MLGLLSRTSASTSSSDLKSQSAERLKKYVQDGGTLICEGLPAYFGDHGHVGTAQPNFGLDEFFRSEESVRGATEEICAGWRDVDLRRAAGLLRRPRPCWDCSAELRPRRVVQI